MEKSHEPTRERPNREQRIERCRSLAPRAQELAHKSTGQLRDLRCVEKPRN
jgi:hypothetical protein